MVKTHNLGFPRIGKRRELKFALENYWKGKISRDDLFGVKKELDSYRIKVQDRLDFTTVGDFSFYDQVLDTSLLFGNLPGRTEDDSSHWMDKYFRAARGRANNESDANPVRASEMTKWFDTNYHYIVPEFDSSTKFELDPNWLLDQIHASKVSGKPQKVVVIGPVTYLWLGKSTDDTDKLVLLGQLTEEYKKLFDILEKQNIEWVQMDEPVLVTELQDEWKNAVKSAYEMFENSPVKILFTSYFGSLAGNTELACRLPVAGLHLDCVRGKDDLENILDNLGKDKVLSLGVIDGRNIWKTNLAETLDWLEPLHSKLKDRLWLAPSCSLLHVPVDLEQETEFDGEIKSWLSFAVQKLDELSFLSKALNEGRDSVAKELDENLKEVYSRKKSGRIHVDSVKERVKGLTPSDGERKSSFQKRYSAQLDALGLPLYPTTTIGSYPQTGDIRRIRRDYKKGEISTEKYTEEMKKEIENCIREQEKLGLDVLVHGEPERNDMVEYFGENLEGFTFSKYGWVQSYGSRCVKPPVIFGDISRPEPITVEWIRYAQSLTDKPVKGMLTGPVTVLNWSFVRDDQPRSETCLQLAASLRDEVLDLEKVGVKIIQIDEAALREGLPLKRSEWQSYLDWAVQSFRITANCVQDKTQIHTHMCYSEFNDIIESIARMDADVITMETSRSNMELLEVFEDYKYPNGIGPGVYDIHSPNVPTVESIVELMNKASERIHTSQLWVNPDCGLKTRGWEEVVPSLRNMVNAAKTLRENWSTAD